MSSQQIAVRLPAGDVEPEKAWTRDSIAPDRWLIPLPQACVAELDEVVVSLRTSPRPPDRTEPTIDHLDAARHGPRQRA